MNFHKHIALLMLCQAIASCGGHDADSHSGEDVLVRVGNSVLTAEELASEIPYGLSAEDSAKYVRAYVRRWIDTRLIGEIASRNIKDMERIDRMVDDYRNELIMWEYRRLMYAEHAAGEVPEDSLRAYYEAHSDDYRLQQPIVKGIFVKLPEKHPRLKEVRRWCVSSNSDDLDRLERFSMDDSVSYDYFRDEWTDRDKIWRKLPAKLQGTPASSLKAGKELELTDEGFVYLLAISDYLPAGSVMPFELVKEPLASRFMSARRPEYDSNLRRQLFEKGVEDGMVEINADLGISNNNTNE